MARIEHRIEPTPDQLRTVEGGKKLKYPVNLVAEAIRREGQEAGLGPDIFPHSLGLSKRSPSTALVGQALERYGSPEIARRYVAPPGRSAHMTGGAMDFDLGLPTCCDSRRVPEYRNTRAFRFLQEIAPKYKKITNYSAEPWHWECDAACEQNILEMAEGGGAMARKTTKALKYAGVAAGLAVLGVGSFLLVRSFD